MTLAADLYAAVTAALHAAHAAPLERADFAEQWRGCTSDAERRTLAQRWIAAFARGAAGRTHRIHAK